MTYLLTYLLIRFNGLCPLMLSSYSRVLRSRVFSRPCNKSRPLSNFAPMIYFHYFWSKNSARSIAHL